MSGNPKSKVTEALEDYVRAQMLFSWPESRLEQYVANDIDLLLPDGWRIEGRQQKIGIGIVDILAVRQVSPLLKRPPDFEWLVIELKCPIADGYAICQVATYVSWLRQHWKEPVRGMVIAPHFSEHCRYTLETMKPEYRPNLVRVLPGEPGTRRYLSFKPVATFWRWEDESAA